MAASKKLYPRSTFKRIIKAHSGCNISKNADRLIFLDYTLFLKHLIREASIDAKQRGEKGLSARSVRKVTEACLRKFKG